MSCNLSYRSCTGNVVCHIKKYQVTVAQIQKWNNLPDTNIKIGQQLIVGYK
ncbi:MAG: LysM peptidoglycan-binding domain-containing protein [Bacteroidetes bacterium]|nr:LysM peptidoglycan-binding domain-containing protein [Bacteroidota bacterium]